MTKASFVKCDGRYQSLSVSGHSGYDEAGKDIVCSAVSSSVNLAMRILENSSSPYECSACEKDATLTLTVGEGETAQTVMRSLEDELRALGEDFPKNIKVTLAER